MEKKTLSGYKEIEHTADWELEVWAPDLATLFEQAAHGMLALMGMRLEPAGQPVQGQEAVGGATQEHTIHLQAGDPESLLVAFLSEILYLMEQQGLGFDQLDIAIQEDTLECTCSGEPVRSVAKEIKAVTYHNLNIHQTERGVEVRLVFDV